MVGLLQRNKMGMPKMPRRRRVSYLCRVDLTFDVTCPHYTFTMTDTGPATPSRLQKFFKEWIFPGKLFPCCKSKIGKDGEVLPPPSLNELLRFIHLQFRVDIYLSI